MWEQISSLENLRVLRLRCAESEAWMLDFDGNRDLAYSVLPTTLRAPNWRMRNLRNQFPSLHTLELEGASPVLLQDDDLQYLPRSLTRLSLPDGFLLTPACLNHLTDLPLIHLDLRSLKITIPGDLRMLPKSLVDLFLAPWLPHTAIVSMLQNLPPSIQHCSAVSLNSLQTVGLLAVLPQSWKQLYMGRQIGDLNCLNPLRHLEVLNITPTFLLDEHALELLPPTLVGLSAAVVLSSSARAELAQLDPQKCAETLRTIFKWPTALKKLTVRYSPPIDYNMGFNRNMLSGLPELHYLDVDCCNWDGSCLPRTLRSLSISCHVQSEKTFVNLPPALTDFSIMSGSASIPSKSLARLPRTVRNLYLSNSTWTKEDYAFLPPALRKLRLSQDFEFDFAHLLPPGLEILDLSLLTAHEITPEKCSVLPKSLTSLDFHTLMCDAIPYLPPTLRRLAVKFLSGSRFFEALPRTLQMFAIHESLEELDPVDLKGLPLSLSLFDCSSLTKDHVPYLPRSLTSLGRDAAEIWPSLLASMQEEQSKLVLP